MQHNLKQLGLTEKVRNASGQFTQSRVAKGQPEAFTEMELWKVNVAWQMAPKLNLEKENS